MHNPYFSVFRRERDWRMREGDVKFYSWAIPTRESVEYLVKHSPLIEIGAGRGYWAYVISQIGGDIVCYDRQPVGHRKNTMINHDSPPWYPVQEGGPEKIKNHRSRALFLCWPYMDDMANKCLKLYKGENLFFVGEGWGGCTASDEFFRRLHKYWKVATRLEIPNWWGIRDDFYHFVRKSDQ